MNICHVQQIPGTNTNVSEEEDVVSSDAKGSIYKLKTVTS